MEYLLSRNFASYHFFFGLQDKELVETCLNMRWLIWNNINQCFHNHSCRVPLELTGSGNKITLDFLLAIRFPHRNCLNLTVDAAYSSKIKIDKLGMVVRDYLGNIHLCAVTAKDNIETPLHAKIKAILFGL